MFKSQPNENDVRRVSVDGDLYNGQHWKESVTLIADETIVIPAESQKILAIKHFANQWEGIEPKTGLVTPIRTKDVLSQKFAVAHMYGKDMQKVVLMNKTSTPLVIKKGTNIAELHPRTWKDRCMRSNATNDHVESDCREATKADVISRPSNGDKKRKGTDDVRDRSNRQTCNIAECDDPKLPVSTKAL